MSGIPGTDRAAAQNESAATFQSGSGGASSASAAAARSSSPATTGSPTRANRPFKSTVNVRSGSTNTPLDTATTPSEMLIVAACGVSCERTATVPATVATTE